MKNKTQILIKICENHQANRLKKNTVAWDTETDIINNLKSKLNGEKEIRSTT